MHPLQYDTASAERLQQNARKCSFHSFLLSPGYLLCGRLGSRKDASFCLCPDDTAWHGTGFCTVIASLPKRTLHTLMHTSVYDRYFCKWCHAIALGAGPDGLIIIIIIIMLPNQAIASTPSAPRPSGAEGRGSTAPLCLQLLRTSQACTRYSAILLKITRHLPLLPQTVSADVGVCLCVAVQVGCAAKGAAARLVCRNFVRGTWRYHCVWKLSCGLR
jgi:hypothetical protein